MKSPTSRRTFLLLAGTGLLTVGCRVFQGAPSRRTFVLAVPDVEAVPAAGRSPMEVLMIRPLRVVPEFDSRSFVIRRGESEFQSDLYTGFLSSPGSMLTEVVAEWVRRLAVFGVVTTGGSQLSPTRVLEGEVIELYGDHREAGSPRAVMGWRLRMLDLRKGVSTPVVWERRERREEAIAGMSAEALVAGWNRALTAILEAYRPWMAPGAREAGRAES